MKDQIEFLSSKDAKLRTIVDTFGFPVVQVREQGFAAMTHIILEQQVSISSAKATYRKLTERLQEITPQNILETPDAIFRECGVSRQKTSYLKDMANRVVSGSLDFASLSETPVEQVIRELLEIKGVGMWSVEVYLMFCLQSPDIIPLGDIAIRNTIKELYDIHELDKMAELAKNWAPHRTLASFVLWHHYLATRNRL